MVRVTKPGGRLVVLDGDWETLIFAATNRLTTAHLVDAIRNCYENPCIGRELSGLFRQAGLADIQIVPDTLLLTDYQAAEQIWRLQATVNTAQARGIITAEAGADWLDDLQQRSREGRFLCAMTGFSVSGRNPVL
jgi:hypothetical protein